MNEGQMIKIESLTVEFLNTVEGYVDKFRGITTENLKDMLGSQKYEEWENEIMWKVLEERK